MLAILTVGDCRNCPIFASDQKRHIIRSPSKHVVHCEVGKILGRVSWQFVRLLGEWYMEVIIPRTPLLSLP